MKQSRGEFETIEVIKNLIGPSGPNVVLGIGDDAAVCNPPRGKMLLCNDALVENVHFRLEWSLPEEIGHKALATCLSDIAAMNGKPLYALVTLALRDGTPDEFVAGFYNGMKALAKRFDVSIVGGDLSKSRSEIFIDVTVVGETENAFKREGAKPGDFVVISGQPGRAAAGLWALQNSVPARLDPLRLAHVAPTPRFDLLPLLQDAGLVTSMIDVSDGLASELHHLARASNCGFIVDRALPAPHPEMKRLAMEHSLDLNKWSLFGGEAYELLFTVDPKRWASQIERHPQLNDLTTVIGQVTAPAHGIQIKAEGKTEPLPDRGWNHFLTN